MSANPTTLTSVPHGEISPASGMQPEGLETPTMRLDRLRQTTGVGASHPEVSRLNASFENSPVGHLDPQAIALNNESLYGKTRDGSLPTTRNAGEIPSIDPAVTTAPKSENQPTIDASQRMAQLRNGANNIVPFSRKGPSLLTPDGYDMVHNKKGTALGDAMKFEGANNVVPSNLTKGVKGDSSKLQQIQSQLGMGG